MYLNVDVALIACVVAGCRRAYMRIDCLLSHRHHTAMASHCTPSRCRSPPKPARNACGVSFATAERARASLIGSACHNIARSQSRRERRVGPLSTNGLYSTSSPSRRSCAMCHRKSSHAVIVALTAPAGVFTAYTRHRHLGRAGNSKQYRLRPEYRCQSVISLSDPSPPCNRHLHVYLRYRK